MGALVWDGRLCVDYMGLGIDYVRLGMESLASQEEERESMHCSVQRHTFFLVSVL